MDDDRCAACGTERGFRFVCSECGFSFCKEHANPSLHRCPELDSGGGAARESAEEFELHEDEAEPDTNESGPSPSEAISASIPPWRAELRSSARRILVVSSAALGASASRVVATVSRFRGGGKRVRNAIGQGVRLPLRLVRGAASSIFSLSSRVRESIGGFVKRCGASVESIGRSESSAERTAETDPADPSAPDRRVLRAVWSVPRSTAGAAGRLLPAPDVLGTARDRPSRRAVIAVALMLVLALTFGAGGGATKTMATLDALSGDGAGPGVATEPGESVTADLQQAIFEEANEARENASVQPFRFDPNLSVIAAYHSYDMADRGYAALESPSGDNVTDRFNRFDYNCERAGQMVLWVDGADPARERKLAESIVNQWLASEEHAAFLRDEGYDRGGVGVSIGYDGRIYVSFAACGG